MLIEDRWPCPHCGNRRTVRVTARRYLCFHCRQQWERGAAIAERERGKRTLLIPSSMGYGANGYGSIPPNAGLVFALTLTAVQ